MYYNYKHLIFTIDYLNLLYQGQHLIFANCLWELKYYYITVLLIRSLMILIILQPFGWKLQYFNVYMHSRFSVCKNIYISRRRFSLSLAIFSVMRNGNLNKFSHLKHALLCIVWTFLSNLPSNPDRVRSPQVWISEIVLYNKSILKRKELKKIELLFLPYS